WRGTPRGDVGRTTQRSYPPTANARLPGGRGRGHWTLVVVRSLLGSKLTRFGRRVMLHRDASARFRGFEAAHVDIQVADLVVENPLRGVEEARGLGAVPARGLERVLDQVALESFDR